MRQPKPAAVQSGRTRKQQARRYGDFAALEVAGAVEADLRPPGGGGGGGVGRGAVELVGFRVAKVGAPRDSEPAAGRVVRLC